MADQKTNVSLVANGLQLPVVITRVFSDWTNEKGKTYRSVKVRIDFEFKGEHFRLSSGDYDVRLLTYLMKEAGLPVLDVEGNPMSEEEVNRLIAEVKN